MRKHFSFFILLFLPIFTLAKASSVRITEISSQTIGNQNEWFEFELLGQTPLDITNWKISNGGTTKTFWDYQENLRSNNLFDFETFSGSGYSGTGFSGSGFSGSGKSLFKFSNALIFLPPKNARAWFFWEKSPVSLKNSGGEISILDENNEVLDKTIFPKLKAGTYQGSKYGEVWNLDEDGNWFPLIFRNNNDSNFKHSRGKENFPAPAFFEDIEILINEVSPDRDFPNEKIDFIELFISHTKKATANLKYCEIKHNGTPLFFFETDFWVKNGDFVIINFDGNPPIISKKYNPFVISTNKKKSISSGSGTIEIILFSGTSWEKTEDFLCWKNGNLSASEKSRVNKNQGENWNGECVDISNLIKNESIARAEIPTDSNTKADFFRHYNGSWGKKNVIKNSPPVAKITVQGAKRIFKAALNFTGEDSTDPDGIEDLKSFEWTKNGEVFSNEINPKGISFEALGKYEIALTVTDYSEEKNTVLEIIEVVANDAGEQVIDVFNLGVGTSSSFNKKQIKSWLKAKLNKKESAPLVSKLRTESSALNVSQDFFKNFIEEVPTNFLTKLAKIVSSQKVSNVTSSVTNSFKSSSSNLIITKKKPRLPRRRIKSLNELFDE